jgi:signal recognition particle GTPase
MEAMTLFEWLSAVRYRRMPDERLPAEVAAELPEEGQFGDQLQTGPGCFAEFRIDFSAVPAVGDGPGDPDAAGEDAQAEPQPEHVAPPQAEEPAANDEEEAHDEERGRAGPRRRQGKPYWSVAGFVGEHVPQLVQARDAAAEQAAAKGKPAPALNRLVVHVCKRPRLIRVENFGMVGTLETLAFHSISMVGHWRSLEQMLMGQPTFLDAAVYSGLWDGEQVKGSALAELFPTELMNPAVVPNRAAECLLRLRGSLALRPPLTRILEAVSNSRQLPQQAQDWLEQVKAAAVKLEAESDQADRDFASAQNQQELNESLCTPDVAQQRAAAGKVTALLQGTDASGIKLNAEQAAVVQYESNRFVLWRNGLANNERGRIYPNSLRNLALRARGNVTLVVGPPGTGKTTVAGALSETASAQGVGQIVTASTGAAAEVFNQDRNHPGTARATTLHAAARLREKAGRIAWNRRCIPSRCSRLSAAAWTK